ncbi:MAG: hypothetical protein M0026_04680 [Nocardiopsaceae bacterium]|nr:hypothetical protein [Nocardiopsaceae bacterium]
MAHRHPSKLNAEHVTHPAARRLLKAELANCDECRHLADQDAQADLEPGGIFDSLLHGFVLARHELWRTRHTRYPVNLYELAPPNELGFLNIPTRETARLCVIKGRAGDRVDTSDALHELRLLVDKDLSLVLDDMIDGILDQEG